MESLRIEAETSQAQTEDLKAKVKVLEQENLAKEQEITSLTHKNQLLEAEVEKLETGIKEAKVAAEESNQHGTQNESLQRRLQLLEDEAEESDKNIRETNEKYDGHPKHCRGFADVVSDYVKRTSKPAITSARYRRWKARATNGKRSTRRWRKNTIQSRRN